MFWSKLLFLGIVVGWGGVVFCLDWCFKVFKSMIDDGVVIFNICLFYVDNLVLLY